jgi:hypothetical protein
MTQPVARYTEEDLERVLARDYGGHRDEVLEILSGYGKERWQTGALRVQMACLKLAKGDVAAVKKYVERARGDFRDVLAWAEYPAYFKGFTVGAEEERQQAIEQDWRQLQAWLHAATLEESLERESGP